MSTIHVLLAVCLCSALVLDADAWIAKVAKIGKNFFSVKKAKRNDPYIARDPTEYRRKLGNLNNKPKPKEPVKPKLSEEDLAQPPRDPLKRVMKFQLDQNEFKDPTVLRRNQFQKNYNKPYVNPKSKPGISQPKKDTSKRDMKFDFDGYVAKDPTMLRRSQFQNNYNKPSKKKL